MSEGQPRGLGHRELWRWSVEYGQIDEKPRILLNNNQKKIRIEEKETEGSYRDIRS